MSQIVEIRSPLCGSEFIREAVARAIEMRWMYRPIANEFAPTGASGVVTNEFAPTGIGRAAANEFNDVATAVNTRQCFAGDRT
ncbi:hypothetical protein ACIPL1_25315 [Pseudomonas sp. NPDC090202]|uniref:hypothetical protein n=1 Tax=unclassified Pseudomonas TaxID=196821 RepID=UPI003810501D